jgi:NarL family two-component system response regulator LiaR
MEDDRITVLIVDDHAIVRKGIRTFLETEPDIEVVGEAVNGREAVQKAMQFSPNVILMDLMMPEMNGIEATRQIMTEQPDMHILVLTSFSTDDKLFPAVEAGAQGYLLKDTGPEELLQAIRRAAKGESTLTPAIVRRLLREFSNDNRDWPPVEPLTDRETEVLRLLAEGLTNEELADRLYISKATARTHVSNILAKLNLANRTQAALYALRYGIASLEDVERSKS